MIIYLIAYKLIIFFLEHLFFRGNQQTKYITIDFSSFVTGINIVTVDKKT